MTVIKNAYFDGVIEYCFPARQAFWREGIKRHILHNLSKNDKVVNDYFKMWLFQNQRQNTVSKYSGQPKRLPC